MALVISSIHKLGVEVEHIPGGCISLCQPVDWEDWMLDSGIITSTTKPPTRKLFVEWVIKAYNNVSVEVVILSWKHDVYTWFDCN